MRNVWKKVVVLLLAASMAAGACACGGGKETPNGPKNPGTDSDNTDAVSYPLDTDVQLTYWCGSQIELAEDINSWQASPFHSGMEDKTGVAIDWKWTTAGSDVGQAYQLLWVDTVLPNMIFYRITSNEARSLLEDGMIWDLTEYLPKYAPNYWAWLNAPENEAEKKEAMLSDGTLYSVASVKEDLYNQVYLGPIVRQDWLTECGLDMPVTLEDWEKVLLAFKEKYGATLSFTSSIMTACGGIASGTGAYGFANTADFRIDDDGNVVIPQTMPEYKAMMEVLTRWWGLGLIDADCLSNNDDSVRQKALSGKTGMAFVMAGYADLIMEDARKEGNGAEWVGMEYPRTAAGEPTSMICTTATRLTGYHTVITTQTSEEELITALRWLDYGWTQEGKMYWNFGDEGISYTKDGNGKPQWTELVTGDSLGRANGRKKYCGVTGSGPVIQLRAYAEANNNEAMDSVIKAWASNTVADQHILPSMEMDEDDYDRYNELWAPITTYINEESLKILTGKSPVSSIDSFISKLYEMGLQDVLDIRQKYYDEYIKK